MAVATVQHQHQELVQRANEFVNQTFYGTLLREFREAEKTTLFDNGPGGKTFIRQLDMELVKRMSAGKPSPVAQALVKQLDRRTEPRGGLSEAERAGRALNAFADGSTVRPQSLVRKGVANG
jgi:Rod binding domain-containing protein